MAEGGGGFVQLGAVGGSNQNPNEAPQPGAGHNFRHRHDRQLSRMGGSQFGLDELSLLDDTREWVDDLIIDPDEYERGGITTDNDEVAFSQQTFYQQALNIRAMIATNQVPEPNLDTREFILDLAEAQDANVLNAGNYAWLMTHANDVIYYTMTANTYADIDWRNAIGIMLPGFMWGNAVRIYEDMARERSELLEEVNRQPEANRLAFLADGLETIRTRDRTTVSGGN